MKKLFLIATAAVGMMTAQAQQALEAPTFGSNWSVGVEVGGITPLYDGSSFIGDMRGAFGAHVQKQISPVFGLGVEGIFGINTSSWANMQHSKTAIDNHYVGAYGTVNFMNLFGGYQCAPRLFEIEAQAGAGWGRYYNVKNYHNFFATKAGLNFNFNVSPNVTLSVKPAVIWDMSDAGVSQSSAAYNKETASFSIMAGFTYKFGEGFKCVDTQNQAEIDALNAQINELRNRKPEVIEKVVEKRVEVPAPAAKTVSVSDLIFVTFAQGKSALTNDAKKALDAVKEGSHVQVVGTASPEGSKEINDRLSQARADVVAKYLKGRGVIVDEATGKGVQGTTSNRLAIVYVK